MCVCDCFTFAQISSEWWTFYFLYSSLPESCWPLMLTGPSSHLTTCKDSTPSSTPPLLRPPCWDLASGEMVLPYLSAWLWRRRELRPSCRLSVPPPCWRRQDSGCSVWWQTTSYSCLSYSNTCGCVLSWTTPRTDWWGCGHGRLLLDWGKRAIYMRCYSQGSWHQS